MSANTVTTSLTGRLWLWLKNDQTLYQNLTAAKSRQIDLYRLGLFLLLHVGVLGVIYTGVSTTAIIFCAALYFIRMFFITAFYHRYFAHRSYNVSRLMQFGMAIAGCTAGQRGPLWWASHHRHHHLVADKDTDPHSPRQGMLDSHLLWIFRKGNFNLKAGHIRDMSKYPELHVLESLHWLPFVAFALFCYGCGWWLQQSYPELAASGPQLLVWGFFISTICLYHATYTINSLAHRHGSKRYNTGDDSRNNLWLALLTLGEGWHNNHHRYPASTRQGFAWWEIDITYILLRLMSLIGLISALKPVPDKVLLEGQLK